MPHWLPSQTGANRVEYRPSFLTFVHLLRVSLIALFLLAILCWYAGLPWATRNGGGLSALSNNQKHSTIQADAELQKLFDELQARLTPEKVAELKSSHQQRQIELGEAKSRLEFQRSVFRMLGTAAHWAAFLALCIVGGLPMLTFPLQKIVIEKSPSGQLAIYRRGLWPTTRKWSANAFQKIDFRVEQETYRRHYQRIPFGWRWLVTLRANQPTPSWPGGGEEIIFHIDHQGERPVDTSHPTENTQRLMADLKRLCAIQG